MVTKLEVLSAKAERGLPPVSERERERDSLIYAGTVMTVNMLIKRENRAEISCKSLSTLILKGNL